MSACWGVATASAEANLGPHLARYDVTVDGYQWNAYTASNLGQPLNAVTVAPDGRVIVADRSGLWQATDTDDVWSLLSVPIGGGSLPFYPG